MRTRTVTILLLALMIAVAAAVLIARPTGPQVAQEEPQPQDTDVIVVLTCNQQQGGGIRVNPYRRELDSGESVTWRGVGNFQGEYTIEPVGYFPWTLTPATGTSDTDREVTGAPPPETGAPDGLFYYLVKFTCNGDEVVLDPRMEVPRR